MTLKKNTIALVAAAGMLAPAALYAQSSQSRQSGQDRQQSRQQERSQSRQRAYQSDQQADRERAQRSNRNRANSQQGQTTLDWDSTTIIGYDLDGDGKTDTFYAASSYDVEDMNRQVRDQQRQMSRADNDRMRQEVDRRRSFNADRRGNSAMRSDMDNANPQRTIQGTIKSLKQFKLTGQNQPRTVARVETNDGQRVAVVLGTPQQMRSLDLQQGDSVRFRTYKGSIDNRRVLVADQVTANGQTQQLRQQRAEDLMRIQGTIVDTRTTTLQNRQGNGEEKLLLKVRNQNGQTRCVLLGPTSRINADRYQRGETISVLAAPTRVNGKHAFAARQVNYDGQSRVISTAGQPQQSR